MKNPKSYPQTKDIKTLEDVLEDVDKKLFITIFDESKPLKIDEKVLYIAHKIGRMQQYFKIITNELIKLKNKS